MATATVNLAQVAVILAMIDIFTTLLTILDMALNRLSGANVTLTKVKENLATAAATLSKVKETMAHSHHLAWDIVTLLVIEIVTLVAREIITIALVAAHLVKVFLTLKKICSHSHLNLVVDLATASVAFLAMVTTARAPNFAPIPVLARTKVVLNLTAANPNVVVVEPKVSTVVMEKSEADIISIFDRLQGQ